MEVGPLRSTGVTRFRRYYGPIRIPADQSDGYAFPPGLESRTRPAGPPRFRRLPSPPAVRLDPGELDRCTFRRLPCPCWLRPVLEVGRSQVVNNEASIGSLALRLTASLAEASHGPLQDRTLGSLRVSSEVHTVSSFHLTGRRQLPWRTGRLRWRRRCGVESWRAWGGVGLRPLDTHSMPLAPCALTP